MAYDAQSDRVIIFGGQIGNIVSGDYIDYDDTWVYDLTANQWTQMEPLSVPTVRSGAELAYDVESDRVIMFGGFSSAIFWADEWAYDYNTNTWMKIAKGPGNRLGTSMAYDEESDRIILFGGWYMNMSGFIENDTWAYDFNSDTWTEMKPSISPPSRNNHAMVYDSKADRVLMWGGTDLDGKYADFMWGGMDLDGKPADFSVWSYDFNTNTWQEMIPDQTHPNGRDFPGMVYDAESDRTILFGGELAGESYGEIWAYDYNTNTWTKFESSTGPGYRSRQGLVYSTAADRVILFGGQVESTEPKYSNETWTYDLNTNTWTNMTSYP
jgi:N-acetylneuraminic acid mutarotase